MTMKKKEPDSKELVDLAVQKALEKKAENIVLFYLGENSGIAEWIMICEGSNIMHTRAIADNILDGCKKRNAPVWLSEGMEEGRWILLDFSTLVISVMLPELRSYYDLEELWREFPRTDITEQYGRSSGYR
jgi:ribosome-associated protein